MAESFLSYQTPIMRKHKKIVSLHEIQTKMKKESLVEVLNELPTEFNLDELIEKLLVIEKIEIALNDIKNGRVISHEMVKKEIKKWGK